jgi:VWFA-related protein
LSEGELEDLVKESGALIYALGIGSDSQTHTTSGTTTTPSRGPVGGSRGGIRLPGGVTIPIPSGRREFLQFPSPSSGRTFPGRDAVNMDVLRSLAGSSGGRAWRVSGATKSNEIRNALDEIAEELRNQYHIGYYPPHPLADRKWHMVDLRAQDDRYVVRSRDEYFGR